MRYQLPSFALFYENYCEWRIWIKLWVWYQIFDSIYFNLVNVKYQQLPNLLGKLLGNTKFELSYTDPFKTQLSYFSFFKSVTRLMSPLCKCELSCMNFFKAKLSCFSFFNGVTRLTSFLCTPIALVFSRFYFT